MKEIFLIDMKKLVTEKVVAISRRLILANRLQNMKMVVVHTWVTCLYSVVDINLGYSYFLDVLISSFIAYFPVINLVNLLQKKVANVGLIPLFKTNEIIFDFAGD